MKLTRLLAATLGLAMAASGGQAEVPPWPQQKLDQEPHIASGTITQISAQKFARNRCQIFVDVTMSVQVGANSSDSLSPYYDIVRGHKLEWVCSDIPAVVGSSGVAGILKFKVGDRIKFYSVPLDDGTYLIRARNGIESSK